MLNFKMKKIARLQRKQLPIDVNYDFVTSFWRTKSHVAISTLTDFLAKARLLDHDVNFICR